MRELQKRNFPADLVLRAATQTLYPLPDPEEVLTMASGPRYHAIVRAKGTRRTGLLQHYSMVLGSHREVFVRFHSYMRPETVAVHIPSSRGRESSS